MLPRTKKPLIIQLLIIIWTSLSSSKKESKSYAENEITRRSEKWLITLDFVIDLLFWFTSNNSLKKLKKLNTSFIFPFLSLAVLSVKWIKFLKPNKSI